MTSQPTFAHVVFPVQNKYLLIVPFSDSLRSTVHSIQCNLIEDTTPESSGFSEIGGVVVLSAEQENLSSLLKFSDRTFQNLTEGLINEKGGGYVLENFDVEDVMPISISSDGNCRVELVKNQSISFSFSLENDNRFVTEKLTIHGFNKLILEAYQVFYDNNN